MNTRPVRAAAALALAALTAPAVADAGWTLRALPDGNPVAVAPGPGSVAEVAAFCLSGAPWLMLRMRESPDAAIASVVFGFAGGDLAAEARREEGAGDAYVIELVDAPLAARLAGRDTAVALRVGEAEAGALSLRGSTVALRGALAACHDF